jgi:predicted CXXCH cytochrome family protein
MTRRTRTAKTLARRIDLSYFKRPHPFRRWRLILSLAAPAIALVWLASQAAAGSKAPYSSGPVSAAHASFGRRCEVCHVTPSSGFRAHVTDTACVACHDAPPHKANETFTPACSSCHLEHRGPVRLAAVGEGSCLQCHRNLETRGGAPAVATRVGSFDSAHPEFAALGGPTPDRTALRFNHQVHVRADLRGPAGPVTLDCQTCHKPQAGLMTPITYEQQCASCHPLFFDPLLDRPAPHEKPEMVRAHVNGALREYIATHPEQVGRPDIVRGRIPVNFPFEPVAPARTPDEWVARRSAAAERLLWGKTCAECHGIQGSQGSLPVIAPVNLPDVWMPRAEFDHTAHQLVTCDSCHRAAASRETTDVLLPGIATCRQCHTPDTGAESRCFECHQYHDRSKAKPVKPRFTLEQLTGELR